MRYQALLALVLGSAASAAAQGARDSIDLVVASTTDVHGRVRGWDYYTNSADPARGLTRAATIVDSVRASALGRVILIDAGDLLQGNPLTFVAARIDRSGTHPVIASMNAMKYDAAAIGNHEFNYGLPTLDRAIAQATFPFLAANAYTPAGKRAYPAYRIVERMGVHVGIVGATTPGSMLWDRDNLRGHVMLRDIVPDVRKAVAEVKAKGADVVVVTVHSGLNEASSYDTVETRLPSENVAARLAHEVDGIDLIVYGHSHRQMADTVIGRTLLTQPKNWATSVSVAHLGLLRDGGKWRVVSRRATLVPAAGHAESPAILAATEQKHTRTIAYVGQAIGRTAVAWRSDSARVTDTPIMDFVLETMRETAHTDLAASAAFDIGAKIDSGAITVAELAKLYPYDNTLVGVRITGRQLRDYLEFSARYFGTYGTAEPATDPKVPGFNFDMIAGADYTMDVSRPIGSRITSLTFKGRPVRDDDHFTLALNNYRASGGGGFAMLRGAPVMFDKQLDIRQLLIDEVRKRGVIRPEDFFHRNWTFAPPAAVARAYTAAAGGDHAFGNVPSPPPQTAAPAGRKATHIRLVAINDFHGALDSRTDTRGVRRGGAAALASVLEREEAKCTGECAWLLVDGGDEFQGTPASNLAFGRPVVEVFNILGVAAAALGNHEFDWGIDTLRARMREERYSMMGANVRSVDGSPLPWLSQDTIVERGGVKIGLVGIALPSTPRETKPSNVRTLQFLEPAPVADEHARSLRQRGAELVVVLAHLGAFCDQSGRNACNGAIIDLAQHVTEHIDAIVSGHTHSLVESVVKGIPIVQARLGGTAVGVIDIPVVPSSARPGTIDVINVLTDSETPQPRVDSIVKRALSAVALLVNRPVATIAAAMPKSGEQYALGNLIADAVREAAHSDVGIMNNGGIRAAMVAGPATYGTAFEVVPLDNHLVRLTVTGAQLRSYLESNVKQLRNGQPRIHVSGLSIKLDTTVTTNRVVGLATTAGAAIDDAKSYTVTINDFMTETEPGLTLARTASSSSILEPTLLESFIDYLKSRPQPVQPPADARITVK
ncbi:MAG: 5'-nucleotidase C-terminal domain-containing protein [Gemmatimonadota bacterium]|nr:5'-nucleotidase C-terminal domain-containing protein [Gemmatimonadota bacterium]